MVISSVGPSDLSSYYSGISSSGSSTNTPSGSALPTQDSINLQLDSSLLQSLSQPGTSVNGTEVYPTNIQQTVQDQVIMATDTNLAQTSSQQVPSPLVESQMEALQTMPAENGSTQSDQSITSLATSMQVLQNITGTGILASNPSLTQSLLQNYTILTNPTSLGSLVNTSA
jgi:hypothetical protein